VAPFRAKIEMEVGPEDGRVVATAMHFGAVSCALSGPTPAVANGQRLCTGVAERWVRRLRPVGLWPRR
jgi:hypothetical protein